MQRRTIAAALATTAAAALALTPAAATAGDGLLPFIVDHPQAAISLTPAGTYETGMFDVSAAEIVAFVPGVNRIFTVNAQSGLIDVIDADDLNNLTLTGSIEVAGLSDAAGEIIPEGAIINSVAVRPDGLAAIAVEHATKTEPGWVVFADATTPGMPTVLGAVRIGVMPDAITISPDGRYAVTSDEGEPNEDYTVDPEGSVSVITLPQDVSAPGQSEVSIADFRAFDRGELELPEGVLVFAGTEQVNDIPEEFPIAQNLEPEYAAVVGDTAYVVLQENNAVATVDLPTASVTGIVPLGFQDHGEPGFGLDPSDRDGGINIRTVEGLYGVYQPEGIGAYEVDGQTFLVTANEGDAREFGDYEAATRVMNLGSDALAPVCGDSPLVRLTGEADLGRLNVLIDLGLRADGSCYENLYSLGSRSFSIWTAEGEQTFDSGAEFERVTTAADPEFFNSNHRESNLEGRSDDKGPEPENFAIGQVGERTYAFIGLERVGGVITYDITDPYGAFFVSYTNNRDFAYSLEDSLEAGTIKEDLPRAGDLGAEGVAFVPANISPSGQPLVIVGNELSGTTTVFEVNELTEQRPGDILLSTDPASTSHDIEEWTFAAGEYVVGDWDGDGTDSLGVRQGNTFLLSNDSALPGFDHRFTFGRAGDRMVAGDFDGDGRDSIALQRGSAIFYLNDHVGGQASGEVSFGRSGDVAFAGDWDGEGTDTFGVQRGAQMFLSNTLEGGNAEASFTYGRAGDTVLVGDTNGDGRETVSLRRGNTFYLNDALTGGAASIVTPFGFASDVPVLGTWQPDASDSVGVIRSQG